MLLKMDASCLLIVDIQEKLTPHVLEPESLIANTSWLMNLASDLKVPTLVSEQYSKGLGYTVKALRTLVDDAAIIDKVHFSCGADDQCLNSISNLNKEHIVIAGIETHVCVLQTAIHLLEQGKKVFVVADAVSARHKKDHMLGLRRMRSHGIEILTKEMVFFEWLRKAGTPEFKILSNKYMKAQ